MRLGLTETASSCIAYVGAIENDLAHPFLVYPDCSGGVVEADLGPFAPSPMQIAVGQNNLAQLQAWAAAAMPASETLIGRDGKTQKATGLCAALGLNCPTDIPSPISPGMSLLLFLALGFVTYEVVKR